MPLIFLIIRRRIYFFRHEAPVSDSNGRVDLISKEEVTNIENLSSKITTRVTLLADALGLDFDRLLAWIFLRVIISAQWFVEDNGNPNEMLFLAKQIYPLLK